MIRLASLLNGMARLLRNERAAPAIHIHPRDMRKPSNVKAEATKRANFHRRKMENVDAMRVTFGLVPR